MLSTSMNQFIHLRSAWSGRSPARCRSCAWNPRACELHSGSANEDRVRLPSAMPDAPPLRPREGGRSRSSARGESGEKKLCGAHLVSCPGAWVMYVSFF